ncbi:hypothetical protein B0H11DRAFT_1614592, partial [Mycena galericulata]
RPANSFILFRRAETQVRRKQDPQHKSRQATLSREISVKWKKLPKEERQYWDAQAKLVAAEHKQQYP